MAPAGAAAGSAQKTNDDSEIVCEGGVCYKKPSSSSSSPTDTSPIQPSLSTLSTSPESTVSHEAKLQQAKELLDKKRKEKEAEAARVSPFKYITLHSNCIYRPICLLVGKRA